MKQCGYCGRENENEATFCCGCATEFAAEIPATTAESASDAVESAADTLVEVQRCRDLESLTELTRILDDAGIPSQRSSLPPIPPPPLFELEKIGAGDAVDGDNAQVMVSVPRSVYGAARAALESAYLKIALPEDDYLLTLTDEVLAEIVGQSAEWSPFDVVHARRLVGERGIAPDRIEEKREEYLRRLHLGRPAPKILIFCGWLLSMLGGVIGLGIGWSLCHMTERTPEGEFFTYDQRSRAFGSTMFTLGAAVIAAAVLMQLSVLFSH